MKRVTLHYLKMIASFKHRGLKRFFEKNNSRNFSADMVGKIYAILTRLDAAEKIEDMDLHSYKLHRLTGDRREEWSVTVRANWRITFRFEEGHALSVNFEDYH